jgi:muramoyltetrapeptide carboxypeptidase LdcA involved in peptidoglycan recycling
MPNPENLLYALRNYGAQGILERINGMIFGKPYHNKYYDEYKDVIKKALKEYSLESLPVLYNLSFGHTSPMIVLPYGALAEIDCIQSAFSILEPGVL